MENLSKQLISQLDKCKIYVCNNWKELDIQSLNLFCFEFLEFTKKLQQLLFSYQQRQFNNNSQYLEQKDYISLSLMQVTTCIRYLEYCTKLEMENHCVITLAHEHFFERLRWCLQAFETCIQTLIKIYYSNDEHDELKQQQLTYDELMDLILDQLENFTSYHASDNNANSNSSINWNNAAPHSLINTRSDLLHISQNVRNWINSLIGNVLAFGNVALKQDRNALSVLSQKVIRDCIDWQELCEMNVSGVLPINESEFKLKAICLENAIYNLENYLNECLLRAIFVSFIDFDTYSMEKLRMLTSSINGDNNFDSDHYTNSNPVCEDTVLDDFVAGFDVNLDRIHQIGLFAVAFTSNRTMKTIIRNCLASFESLDSFLIPAILTKEHRHHFYVKLLIQHYNEEVKVFKKTIYQIVHSQQFVECYYDNVNNVLQQVDKKYHYESLKMLTQMGEILIEQQQQQQCQHQTSENQQSKELFLKFQIILKECQTIINMLKSKNAVMEQGTQKEIREEVLAIDKRCVIKRFKILRSILQKFLNGFNKDKNKDNDNYNNKNEKENHDNGHKMIKTNECFNDENVSISLDVCKITTKSSIFYERHNSTNKKNDTRMKKDKTCNNNVIAINNTKEEALEGHVISMKKQNINSRQFLKAVDIDKTKLERSNIRLRKRDSLRCALFKKQNRSNIQTTLNEAFKNITNGSISESLHITEILNEISGASGAELFKQN